MKHKLSVLFFLVCGSGCRDSADALCRDYRNLNNEAIDALMMITNEDQAKVLGQRILKEYSPRLMAVDFRVKNWKQNNEQTDYGSQIYLSDSMVIMLVESEINKGRLELEMARLGKLVDQLVEEAKQAGNANASAASVCPELAKIADPKNGDVDKIRSQLERGGGDVGNIRKELDNDEKLLKRGKMKEYKEIFDKKYEEFKQTHMAKLSA